MRGYNQATLVGNLGADPEMKFTPTGRPVTTFSIACSRKYTTEDGKEKEDTQWFNIVTWDKLAETCNKFLSKGDPAMVIGRLVNRSWDGTDGQKHYKTEIIAGTVNFLNAKGSGDSGPSEEEDMPF